jgi:hypothetical protein
MTLVFAIGAQYRIASQGRSDVMADGGYFNSPEILARERVDIIVTMPTTSGAKSKRAVC